MSYGILAIFIAYLLDLVFGDPEWHWHPVRLIGRLIEKLENKLNPALPKENESDIIRKGGVNSGRVNKKFCGAILVILVVGATAFCVWGALRLAKFIHPFFYYGASVLFIYFSLSIKSLAVEAGRVYKDLKSGDIQKARDDLSMIVARDTKGLDEPEIIRASVETVAESTMDGIVAPLFYAFLGGPVLVWVYKAINTLDSMVGYKNERFIEFGRLSALLDGAMSFIPAKITCFLISISSFCYGKDWLNSLKQGSKYLFQGPKINSESTEAAMAGGLKIRLGGVNFYTFAPIAIGAQYSAQGTPGFSPGGLHSSVPVYKPFIGEDFQPLAIEHIRESIRIAYISSALMVILGMIV